MLARLLVVLWVSLITGAFVASAQDKRTDAPKDKRVERHDRDAVIASAQVWLPTEVERMDLRRGPDGRGSFAAGATVVCEYEDEDLSGNSPKFSCVAGTDDELKVKYGGTNGEVYAEVAAARLLWALGFGADRMYPVRVICRGCPRAIGGIELVGGDLLFDPAVIERKGPGEEIEFDTIGWSWNELDDVDPERGGAPLAHRDALELLAVFLQHTDSKPEQQRIVCLSELREDGRCARPFLMINDVGLTFGRASWTNSNAESAVNLEAWSRTPVWRDDTGCVGNLPRSLTGTLHNPVISEEGRRFLASLLTQLSDDQLHDLFEVARFNLRPRSPESGRSGFPSIQEWVDAFKEKRRQIVERRC